MKKRRKKNNHGPVMFTAVVLVVLLILALGKVRGSKTPETLPEEGIRTEDGKQPAADAAPDQKEPAADVTPEQEEPAESETTKETSAVKSEEEERAGFLPDYTSAPLLNTTPIKCLTMEIGETEQEVRFNWFSPSPSKGRVNWKDSATGQVQSFEAQCTASVTTPGYYVNKATVTGLQAGASYTYQVGNDEAWSPEYSYQAPAETGSDLTFLVTADAQIGQSQMETPETTAERWDSVVTRLLDYVPEAKFLFHLGDQVADFGSIQQYDLFFEHLALYRIPLAPIVGNHDIATDYLMEKNQHPAAPYFYEHYNVPNRSNVAQSQYDQDGNYYFVRNKVLFIVLNSSTNQPQEVHDAYVAQVVAENPDVNWKILVQHYPAYAGRQNARNDNNKEYLARITSEHDIDLVLTAHDHVYSRTAFVNGLCETLNDYDYAKGAVETNPEGTMYVTCSTSSGCLYNLMEEEIRIVWQGQPEVPMALRVDITEQELHLRAYLVDSWTVYDEYTIRKE